MPSATRKILAQSNLAATTATDLYTVPAATTTKLTQVTIANISASAITVRLSFAIAGASEDAAQWIYYGLSIPANNTLDWSPPGAFLQAGVVVRGYASDTNAVFQLFGEEVAA